MIFDLVDYILGILKMFIYKIVYLNKICFNPISKFSSHASIRIFNSGSLKIGKSFLMRSGVKIRINDSGEIIIGNKVGFNNNCLINCIDKIEIGDNTIFGQGVMVYDHDHVFKKKGLIRESGYESSPIFIGENVWIGSGCVILKGAKIESGSVIAANTIVKGNIPQNSLVYDKIEECKIEILRIY